LSSTAAHRARTYHLLMLCTMLTQRRTPCPEHQLHDSGRVNSIKTSAIVFSSV
jgi:hypothetical protein